MTTQFSGQIEEMRNKEYRHGMVAAQIEIDLPFQIRALRKQRGWTQPQLATEAEMKQPRISAMEKPGGAHFTLETLRRLAEAFDVALVVHFSPFTDLLDWSTRFNPDNFAVPSFEEDLKQHEEAREESGVRVRYLSRGKQLRKDPKKRHRSKRRDTPVMHGFTQPSGGALVREGNQLLNIAFSKVA
jgi:transcriptional regulator with XRE-family HTH domain